MKVPYNEIELMTTLATMDDSILLKEDVQDSLRKRFSLTQAEWNVQAATFHGIAVLDFLNSPNYTTLLQSYRESCVTELVQYLESQGYSHKESWAVICVLLGVIAT